MKIKYAFFLLFLIFFQSILADSASVSTEKTDCKGYKEDQTIFHEKPSFYFFRLGLCELRFINDEKSFNNVVDLLQKALYVPKDTADYQPEAYFLMGVLYEIKYNSGRFFYGIKGNPQDIVNAIKNYEKATLSGCSLAANNLGELYLDEANINKNPHMVKDVPDENAIISLPDLSKAVYWLTLAAKSGNPAAQGTLSDLYKQGIGVTQDYVLAYVWQNLSTAGQSKINDIPQSLLEGSAALNRNIRDKLYNQLTSGQKDKVQELLGNYTRLYFKEPTPIDKACRYIQVYSAQADISKIINQYKKFETLQNSTIIQDTRTPTL